MRLPKKILKKKGRELGKTNGN